jgi:hypothetical protein
MPPVTRSASSATGSHDRCCRLLLPEDQKGPVPRSEPAFDLREVFTFGADLGRRGVAGGPPTG